MRIPVDDVKRLRSELRHAMPQDAFKPQPLRGVIALSLVPAAAALMWAIATGRLPGTSASKFSRPGWTSCRNHRQPWLSQSRCK